MCLINEDMKWNNDMGAAKKQPKNLSFPWERGKIAALPFKSAPASKKGTKPVLTEISVLFPFYFIAKQQNLKKKKEIFMKPIIGITPDYCYETKKFMLSEQYVKAVEQAGGYAVLLCPNEAFPDFIDGLLLTGGGDIDPVLFGEEPIKENGEISPLRDDFEWRLYQQAQQKKLAVLGICRGMQLMAILHGGSIYQDIFSQSHTNIKHMQKAPRFYPTHSIEIAQNSILYKIAGADSCMVNSFHHQSVKEPGNDFLVCAKSKDGLIEAIEHKTAPFVVGVQWHPEAMTKCKIQRKLFEMFIKAAKEG